MTTTELFQQAMRNELCDDFCEAMNAKPTVTFEACQVYTDSEINQMSDEWKAVGKREGFHEGYDAGYAAAMAQESGRAWEVLHALALGVLLGAVGLRMWEMMT